MDTSALVKRYANEENSDNVLDWMDKAALIGTALITRPEMVATLTRAVRGNRLPAREASEALDEFRADWLDYQHVNIDDVLIARADFLASTFALRGYDAVHLACALTWSEFLGAPVAMATFDKELRLAAKKSGLDTFPQE
jgi:predicted nucleic acid-binding protein